VNMSDNEDKKIINPKGGKAKEKGEVNTYDEMVVNNTKGSINSVDYISYANAFKMIVYSSIPSIIGLVFQILVEVVNLIFIGHTGDPVALGGVGLGNMLFNVV
jgi:Na+-driven multidrug efflux pump